MNYQTLTRIETVGAAALAAALITAPALGQDTEAPYDSACAPYFLSGAIGMERVLLDVSLATPDVPTACHANPGHTVWFQVAPIVDSLLTFSTCDIETTYDTVVQGWIATGDCEFPTRIDSWCSDDDPVAACYNACSPDFPRGSIVTVQATAGTTYLFQVGSFNQNSAGCDLVLGASLVVTPTPPSNDYCADAQSIGEGAFPFDTSQATTDGPALPPSCAEGAPLTFFQDLWYRYTPSCSGAAMIDLCSSNFDTRLAVYRADGLPGDLIACNDDSCGLYSRLQFDASAGAEYLIRIGGYSTIGGTGTMLVDCAPNIYLDASEFEDTVAERGLQLRAFEDFSEAILPPPPEIVLMNDPLDETTDNGVFIPGDIDVGLIFQSNVDGAGEGGVNPRGEAGLIAATPITLPGAVVGANVGPDGFDIVIGLHEPLPDEAAIGLHIADIDAAGEIQVSMYDINGDLLTRVAVTDQPAGYFVGAIPINIPGPGGPLAEIARVNIWAPAGTREGVYDILVYAPPPTCPADVDGSNEVDFQDLLQLLAAWGPCEGCPADIDESNLVDFQDLLQLLAAWGPCL